MRLRYASVVLLLAVAACSPEPLTVDEAMSVTRSHMQGDAMIRSVRNGRLGGLVPDTDVGDPNRLVWVLSLRGVFQFECTVDAANNRKCPDEPVEGFLVLDYFDGSSISVSTFRIIPPTEPPPTGDLGAVS